MLAINSNALFFLIGTVFDLYLFILIIRFFLALAGADYSHPITQFVVKFTNFLVKPMRKIIPDFRGIEIATLALIILIEMIKFFTIISLKYGLPNLLGLTLLAIGDSIKLGLEVLSFVFLLQLIMYWLQPTSPINQVLNQFTLFFMRPIQRLLAPSGTSYIWVAWVIAFSILQITIIIFINPLLIQGSKIAIG